jgi:hypothetical protein
LAEPLGPEEPRLKNTALHNPEVLKPGVATHLCVADILQCVAK